MADEGAVVTQSPFPQPCFPKASHIMQCPPLAKHTLRQHCLCETVASRPSPALAGALERSACATVGPQASTFLLGGYETTSAAIAFTCYLLSANPDKQARLLQVPRVLPHFMLHCEQRTPLLVMWQ